MLKMSAEDALLASLKAKEHSAFQEFYSRYAPALYGDLLRSVHPRKLADETFTCAFVRIWNSIDQFDPTTERLLSWSLKIVRKEACEKKVCMAFEALLACRRSAA